MPNGSRSTSDRARETLERIAKSLGCSVEALISGEGLPPELAQADELLTLWLSLTSDEDRERLLRALREAAETAAH